MITLTIRHHLMHLMHYRPLNQRMLQFSLHLKSTSFTPHKVFAGHSVAQQVK